jgi:hypothetical protein
VWLLDQGLVVVITLRSDVLSLAKRRFQTTASTPEIDAPQVAKSESDHSDYRMDRNLLLELGLVLRGGKILQNWTPSSNLRYSLVGRRVNINIGRTFERNGWSTTDLRYWCLSTGIPYSASTSISLHPSLFAPPADHVDEESQVIR